MKRVEALLNEGRYSEAFAELAQGVDSPRPQTAARAALGLAEFYGMYGPGELENMEAALAEAEEILPAVRSDPLYRALTELVRAYKGLPPQSFVTDDPRVAYHLARAELAFGRPERALELLSRFSDLPRYLKWQALELKGRALEELGRYAEAADAYERAMFLAPPSDRPFLALDVAAAATDAGDPERALAALEAGGRPPDPKGEQDWLYAAARAELALGNPEEALALLGRIEEPSVEVELERGRALMDLGRHLEAEGAFRAALEMAEGRRTDVLHELAIALLEAGKYAEAEEILKDLVEDAEYGYRGTAAADLAELYYRLADLAQTEYWAKEALRLGDPAGELFLGHVAYDRMRLEEALAHYRRVADRAPVGSREWLVAQQTAVEILAQLGYPDPEEVLRRAEAALAHTPPADEWAGALKHYAERARELRFKGRSLN